MTNQIDVYATKDIGEATALLCKSAKLLRLEKDINFYWFIFADKNICNELANTYWSSELQVIAKDYADSFRNLKDRLFAGR